MVEVDTTVSDDWWEGTHKETGKRGLFPCEIDESFEYDEANFVKF